MVYSTLLSEFCSIPLSYQIIRSMKLLITILFLLTITTVVCQKHTRIYLFIGSYTEGIPGTGIYVYEFNQHSGKLKPVSQVENLTNASFITISPNGQFLYAVTESKLPQNGSVSAFKIDSINGGISLLNKQSSGGENPVYLSVSSNKKLVVNANYTTGSVSVYSTNMDGSLTTVIQLISFSGGSINEERQDQAHIHAAVFSPKQDFVFFPDLGSDLIRVFQVDTSQLLPLVAVDSLNVQCVLGSGPRHFIFHPNQRFVYCMEELSGMVSAYTYSNGKLTSNQRIFSYSKVQESYGSADIHISPDGRFLYTSNRWENENTLAIFSIDSISGTLKLVGHQSTFGDHPRNFVIDPSGNFLLVANQATQNIVVFRRDVQTGLLTKLKSEITLPTSPSCLEIRVY